MVSDRPECRAAFEARLDDTSGEQRWQRHLAGCGACREQHQVLGRLLAPLREEEPPRLDTQAQATLEDDFLSRIRREETPPLPAVSAPHRRRWYLAGAIAAALLVLLGAAWIGGLGRDFQEPDLDRDRSAAGMQPPDPRTPAPRASGKVLALAIRATGGRVVHRSASGQALAPPSRLSPGTELETMDAQAFATLESPARDLRLRLGPRSRLRRLPLAEHHLRLERGELMTEVRSKNAGGSLRIYTPQGTVTVRGTRFRVQVGAGKTVVTVLSGVVHYRSRVAGAHLVGRQKRLEDDSQRVTVIGAPGSTSPSGLDAGVGRARAGCHLRRIRRLIRSNRARAARTAIAACRQAGVHATTATLLKVLDAQALLSLGKVGAAVKAYHRIARQHRGSRVGQNALFTAGQLELSRLGQRKRALATFRGYLRAYPSGRYASEARQLIRTLEKHR